MLAGAGLTAETVDWYVPHQANLRIIGAVGRRLGIAPERTLVNVDRYGNTSAASVPLVLAEAVEAGHVRPGTSRPGPSVRRRDDLGQRAPSLGKRLRTEGRAVERTELLDAIRDLAIEMLDVDPADVAEAASFGEDLEADSLDLAELVMALEERFDTAVPEEALEDVLTVGQAVDMLCAVASGSSGAPATGPGARV